MVHRPHPAIAQRRGDEHGACVEVREHLVAEPDGSHHQYEGKLRGSLGGHGRRSSVGGDMSAGRSRGGAAGAGGPFQDLSLHLRVVDNLVPGLSRPF